MDIGILGTGGMADALATQWARTGHTLLIGGRDTGKAAKLADRIGFGATSGTLADAAAFGPVALLAVTGDAVSSVLTAAGADHAEGTLRGRTLIDCTNTLDQEHLVLAEPDGPSTAERIAARTGAHVVKAFNLCHEDVWRMTPPVFGGTPLLVPLCGDDPAALSAVRALVADLGCVPADSGGLRRAGLMEAAAAFLIGLYFGGADARAAVAPLQPAPSVG